MKILIVSILSLILWDSTMPKEENTICYKNLGACEMGLREILKDTSLFEDSITKVDSLPPIALNKHGFCKSLFSEKDCKFIQTDVTKLYYKSLIIKEYRKLNNDSSTEKVDTFNLDKSKVPVIPGLEDFYDKLFSIWKIEIDIRPYVCDSHLIIDKYKLYEIIVYPTTLDSNKINSIKIVAEGGLNIFPSDFKILVAFREENPHYSNRLLYLAGNIPLDYKPEIIKANSFDQQVELYNKIKIKFEKSSD